MILKRYGSHFHSVTPDFDPNAMNEIGFQRTDEHSLTAQEFEEKYEHCSLHELTAAADGDVQAEAEAAVLALLRADIDKLHAALDSGDLLVIISESGKDYPKLRETVKNEVRDGINRLHFRRTVEPPLRVAVYRLRQS